MRFVLILILTLLTLETVDTTVDYIIVENTTNNIIEAIILLESCNDSSVVNKDAVGVLQIRPIMVKEVNAILGYNKYKLVDRFDSIKSIEMFNIYTNHHTPSWDLELVARRWNGGYNGETKLATYLYYRRVKKLLKNNYCIKTKY